MNIPFEGRIKSCWSDLLSPAITYVLFSLVMVCFSGNTSAWAIHPFHISIGEMEWNPKEQHWEVGLRIHPSDLQAAIQRTTGRPFEIQTGSLTSEPPKAMLDYVRAHFYLLPSAAELNQPKCKLEWVGSEEDAGWLWIYFVLAPESSRTDSQSSDRSNWHLVHQLFLEDVEGQSNTLLIRRGGKRATLRFVKGSDKHPLP